ncbi:MAG: serine/threonine protein kinase [Deltaproteobacteria bacterium]|nr:serine/threonine protein kinase [Deltaproteobacteria bacterium]
MSEPTSELPVLPPDPDLEVGQPVGEYHIEGKLGQGAFGTVFRAAHPLIGKVVAIKVLARRFSVDPEMVSRFVAEARAVNQIRHRHIIDIFAFGQLEDGRHYYVMEHLDGETLDARLERDGRMSLAEALPILRAIARALDSAHAKGIAHRDLKAENVFLGREADGGVFPKLLDFGIAKLLAPDDGLKHKTRTGTPVGTPYYMSPEQCRGRDVDHRTDLYALGVLAYLMLAGEFPHDADDYMSILIKQMSDHPAPPSTIAPELPAAVDEAIAWLMKKDPADRPSHARAAIQALEAAAGIAVGPPSAAWDAQTGPIGARTPTTGQSVVPSAPVTTQTGSLAPAKPSRRGLVISCGAIAAAAIAAVAIYLATRGTSEAPAVVETAPAQPSQPAPAPPPQPEQPPVVVESTKPKHVTVDVAGVPEGTEVLLAGATMGVAPGPVTVPRGDDPVTLTFKLDGYLPASRTLTPDRDQKLAVTLKKKGGPAVAPRPGPNKDDIIDIDFSRKKVP